MAVFHIKVAGIPSELKSVWSMNVERTFYSVETDMSGKGMAV